MGHPIGGWQRSDGMWPSSLTLHCSHPIMFVFSGDKGLQGESRGMKGDDAVIDPP